MMAMVMMNKLKVKMNKLMLMLFRASVFAGCLYTYTGTEQHYCFKEIPTLNAKLDAEMPLHNVSRPCLANFPGITTMSEEEQARLCCGHQVTGDIGDWLECLNSFNIPFLRTVKKTPAVFWMRSVFTCSQISDIRANDDPAFYYCANAQYCQ